MKVSTKDEKFYITVMQACLENVGMTIDDSPGEEEILRIMFKLSRVMTGFVASFPPDERPTVVKNIADLLLAQADSYDRFDKAMRSEQ